MKALIVLSLSLALGACSDLQQNQSKFETDISENAIIRGEVVQLIDKRFKSVVGVLMVNHSGVLSSCTGTLIETDIVLTAAHCLKDRPAQAQLYVVFGSHLFNHGQVSGANEVIETLSHSLYDSSATQDAYDIALVRFKGTPPSDAVISPLLKDSSFLKPGTPIVIAGFGRDSHFASGQTGQLKFVRMKVASSRFSMTEFKISQFLQGACFGDSGGPAFVEIDGVFHVAGITNRVGYLGRLDCVISSYFARVDYFQNWISQNLENLRVK